MHTLGAGPAAHPPARAPRPHDGARPVGEPQRVVGVRDRPGRLPRARARPVAAHPRALRRGDARLRRRPSPAARRAPPLPPPRPHPARVEGGADPHPLLRRGPRVRGHDRRAPRRAPHGRLPALPRRCGRHGPRRRRAAPRGRRPDRHPRHPAGQAVPEPPDHLVHGHLGHLGQRVDGAAAPHGDRGGGHPVRAGPDGVPPAGGRRGRRARTPRGRGRSARRRAPARRGHHGRLEPRGHPRPAALVPRLPRPVPLHDPRGRGRGAHVVGPAHRGALRSARERGRCGPAGPVGSAGPAGPAPRRTRPVRAAQWGARPRQRPPVPGLLAGVGHDSP